uniref:Uncharacterized protein n=1 Tax=Glossina austeni TaxID=7395 RepID=A0A1A9V0L3_GLOAU
MAATRRNGNDNDNDNEKLQLPDDFANVANVVGIVAKSDQPYKHAYQQKLQYVPVCTRGKSITLLEYVKCLCQNLTSVSNEFHTHTWEYADTVKLIYIKRKQRNK